MLKIKPRRCAPLLVLVAGGTICFWLQRWVMWYFLPHLVFVVPPWSDDLYYLALQIKEGVFHSHPIKPAFRKHWNSAPIAQQHCCGREASQCKNISLLAAQPLASAILPLGRRELFHAGGCNCCLFCWDDVYSAQFCPPLPNDRMSIVCSRKNGCFLHVKAAAFQLWD